MLARSGVARRHLIDVDYKVQFVARALHATASSVQVDPRVELWRGSADGAELLQNASMRSIILVPKLSCSRIAYRTISRHFLPWALAQYRTRRAYKSPTYPRSIMSPSRAPCASVSAPSSPTLSGHLRRRRRHTLPPPTLTMTHLQPRPRPHPHLPLPRANTQSWLYSHPRYPGTM
ncbi:hypothetical protein BGW80DRAFT_442620 [Lactifluus volemus]|nr:hypothetical protein BGW80DRAFT_442620 [Lactifluus volemus]